MAIKDVSTTTESIPFYRNVKVIGVLAQIIFVILLAIALGFVFRNVAQGVKDLGIPAGFGWVGNRSGIPISESPIPYDSNTDTFARVILIGFLNTLKIALLGVVLATILGVLVALMRLSKNWVLRQIATVYIETVRNIPLAIQIFFWFTVILIPSLPTGTNAISLGQAFLNNTTGFSIPWPYYTQNVFLWLPWLAGALVLAIIVFLWRRRQIIKSELPGNPWPLTLLALFLVAGLGYFISNSNAKHPDNLTLEINPNRGRVTSFIDSDANGEFSSRTEQTVRAIPLRVTIDEGTLDVIPDKRKEVGKLVYSSFRFPRMQKSEFSEAEVSFVNPETTQGLSIHYDNYPTIGRVYNDRNGNGKLDAGEDRRTPEEIEASGRPEEGYEGADYRVLLTVKNFSRKLVTDNDGETRFPNFEGDNVNAQTEILPASLYAWSRPSFPTERPLIVGGLSLTNSYMALLLALVIYTASFIAEIVRGGILSVPKGQTEAANALSLGKAQVFNLVVFPQAMRIIIPPMISQFLNLTKNSSLGFLAAYPEFFKVSEIVSNQSGASVPMIILLIIGYLVISLTFSIILNIFNARVRLVTR